MAPLAPAYTHKSRRRASARREETNIMLFMLRMLLLRTRPAPNAGACVRPLSAVRYAHKLLQPVIDFCLVMIAIWRSGAIGSSRFGYYMLVDRPARMHRFLLLSVYVVCLFVCWCTRRRILTELARGSRAGILIRETRSDGSENGRVSDQ